MLFGMSIRHLVKISVLLLVVNSGSTFAADSRIGILVFDGVLSSDVTAPAEVFGVASRQAWFSDYDVLLIGVEDKSSITTEEGIRLAPDFHIGDSPSLDVLIVPSSYDMKWLFDNQPLTQFIQAQNKNAKWMASNCSGAFLLANAGLLDGKRATTWAGGEKELQKKHPKVKVIKDQNVVIDGKYITSNGSVVSYQAALVLLAKMSSQSRAREVFDTLQMARITDWSVIEKLTGDK